MAIKVLLTGLVILFSGALSGSEGFKPHCDLIGDHLSRKKAMDQNTCWNFCALNERCAGAVYISGWNRCFMKSKIKRKATLKLFSGERNTQGKYDRDYTGKDLRRHVVKTKEECQKHCDSDDQCKGFTYLEGYQDCWIKNTKGKLFEKIFYCKLKEPS